MTMIKRVLNEERKRIAEELHDSVSQHLFGIVFAVHSLKRDWYSLPEERRLELLDDIQQAGAAAARQLRATIYDLSGRQNSRTSWIGIMESQLANFAKLHGVRIRFLAPESVQGLTLQHQKAVCRIISESVGNAVRHGGSSIVDVRLTVEQGAAILRIDDNGTGCDMGQLKLLKPDSGFGIGNMLALAASLGGTFEIDGRTGRGTRILVQLPLADAREETFQTTKSG